jgi:predicted transglutaminase-like protease
MKQFIIINGTSAHIVKRETLRLAIDSAQNTCDFSKEVIVRELDDDSVNEIIRKANKP